MERAGARASASLFHPTRHTFTDALRRAGATGEVIYGMLGWSRGNMRDRYGSVTMAWGIVRGEDALFRTGVASFVGALDQMRPDGSLPLETARGARALHYQRHAISSLVAIAEMAATQGYDLYRLESDTRGSLRRAIDFLVAAIEDPALVLPYAQENWNPGPFDNYLVQDLGFMTQRGHGRHYMAWVEPYAGRFPDSATSLRLGDLLAGFGAERPLIDEFSGGNMSCFFAQVR